MLSRVWVARNLLNQRRIYKSFSAAMYSSTLHVAVCMALGFKFVAGMFVNGSKGAKEPFGLHMS